MTGSVAQAMAHADLKLEEQYTVQYIAHAPLEPRAAVAEWNGGKLTVWTGTQRPFGVRDELDAGISSFAGAGARDSAGHGQRLRRQAYRRGSN